MKSIQYTIRSIPKPVDQVLRNQAKASGRSFNSVVVEALEKATGTTNDEVFTDLDEFIGCGIEDAKSFTNAMDWLDSLPHNLDEAQ